MRKLNWTPVHNGPIYCSSACGCGCTYAAYQEATESSEALAKNLGSGWEPHVWENGGWHYSARRDCCEVMKNKGVGFTAYFNGAYQHLGRGLTEKDAFQDAVNKVKLTIMALQDDLERFED